MSRLPVEHPGHGAGLVWTTPLPLGPGPPVVVRFAEGLLAVSRQSLRLLDGSPWPGLAPAYRSERISGEQRRASRWLESLRLGTVARGEGERLTVGRAMELSQIESDLEATLEQGGACRVFRGAYGAGKSHLLEILAARAAGRGLAVAHAVLDQRRVAASRPRRLLHELLRGLRLPARAELGLAALSSVFDEAVGRPISAAWDRHPYLSPLLDAWSRLPGESPLRQELLYWISGGERVENRRLRASVRRGTGFDPGPFYALKDHRTAWNQLTSLISGLAWLLRESGQAPGLVLILDEAEMCASDNVGERRHGDRTLTGLAAVALGARAVRRPELLRQPGGHQAVREFPAFHRGRSHLYLALGMASRAAARQVLEGLLPKETFLDLAPLSTATIAELLEHILKAYRQAFPHFEMGVGLSRPLARLLEIRGPASASPRQVVQQALAFLDGARLWPGSMESYIEECLAQI